MVLFFLIGAIFFIGSFILYKIIKMDQYSDCEYCNPVYANEEQ